MTEEAKKTNAQDYDMLTQAFDAFSETTLKFQEGYSKLEERIAYLTKELEEKNAVLEENVIELAKTHKYLNNILENVSDGVMALDLNGYITTFNKAAQTITGFSAGEIIDKRYDALLMTRSQGKDFVKDVIREITLLAGQETIIKNKEGKEVPVIAYTAPITNEHSCVVGIVITFNDLSKIKQLENEIECSKRLASLGEMAAGVAHEIRNPLGGIEMFASLLERECATDDRKKKIAESIIQGVRSLNKIVTGLLTFTRSLNKTNFHTIDLVDAVESAIQYADQNLKEKGIEVYKTYDVASSVFIQGDPDQLRQVLLNLLLNAVQAINHDAGKIRIVCQARSQDGYVVLEIADNGCGVKKEDCAKIFNPFYTTKEKGTGLGLAISYRIIEAHGGKITVISEDNKGTRFSIYLPLGQGA